MLSLSMTPKRHSTSLGTVHPSLPIGPSIRSRCTMVLKVRPLPAGSGTPLWTTMELQLLLYARFAEHGLSVSQVTLVVLEGFEVHAQRLRVLVSPAAETVPRRSSCHRTSLLCAWRCSPSRRGVGSLRDRCTHDT